MRPALAAVLGQPWWSWCMRRMLGLLGMLGKQLVADTAAR